MLQYKALPDGRLIARDARRGTYRFVAPAEVPVLVPVSRDLSDGRGDPTSPAGDAPPQPQPEDPIRRRHKLMILLAMLKFQRRAHAVGDPEASRPYLAELSKMLADPNSARQSLQLSWRAEESKTGRVKAVGEAEHVGRVLYGARAEAALRNQERLGHGNRKIPEPDPRHSQWRQASMRAKEILGKVAGFAETPEDLEELQQHLPYLPVDRLNSAKSILQAQYKGVRGRAAAVNALMDHIRGRLGVMHQKAEVEPELAAAEAEMDQEAGVAPEIPAAGADDDASDWDIQSDAPTAKPAKPAALSDEEMDAKINAAMDAGDSAQRQGHIDQSAAQQYHAVKGQLDSGGDVDISDAFRMASKADRAFTPDDATHAKMNEVAKRALDTLDPTNEDVENAASDFLTGPRGKYEYPADLDQSRPALAGFLREKFGAKPKGQESGAQPQGETPPQADDGKTAAASHPHDTIRDALAAPEVNGLIAAGDLRKKFEASHPGEDFDKHILGLAEAGKLRLYSDGFPEKVLANGGIANPKGDGAYSAISTLDKDWAGQREGGGGDPAGGQPGDAADAVEPGKQNATASGVQSGRTAAGKTVHFEPHPKAGPDDATVMIDPRKFDVEWSKHPAAVLPDGTNAVPGKLEGVKTHLASGKPMHAVRAALGEDGSPDVIDGRHRIRAMADAGMDQIAATVPKSQVDEFVKKYGAGDKAKGIAADQTVAEEKPTTPAIPEQPQAGNAYTVPTSDLLVDPDRFQFKLNVNKEGVTDELKGVSTFNPELAGVVAAWKDPNNGKTYVVNGHHRHELANRTGHPHMNVMYIDATDAKEARAKGALINIAEGRGTALDAAKFMRDTGHSPEEMQAKGISLKGKLAADAAVLTKLNDRAFDRLARGTLDQNQALAVARHLPDPDRQEKLFNLLAKREEEGKDLSDRTVEEMARMMAASPSVTKTEATLWGPEETTEDVFVQRAELAAHVRGELAKEFGDFAAVASTRRAGRVEGAGNVLNVDENKKRAEEAEQAKNLYDQLVNRKGPISEALNDAAVQFASAKTKKERDNARKQAVENVRSAIRSEFEQLGGKPDDSGGAGEATEGRGEVPGVEPGSEPTAGTADAGGGEAESAGVASDANDPFANATADHASTIASIPASGLGWVAGHQVRNVGDGKFQVETQKSYKTGSADEIAEHIRDSWRLASHEKGAANKALQRAEGFQEPDWFGGGDAAEQITRRRAAVPEGARGVSLEPHTRGRMGTVTRDENGATHLLLDGGKELKSVDFEPLAEQHSWRVPEAIKPPRVKQTTPDMFAGPERSAEASDETANEIAEPAEQTKSPSPVASPPEPKPGDRTREALGIATPTADAPPPDKSSLSAKIKSGDAAALTDLLHPTISRDDAIKAIGEAFGDDAREAVKRMPKAKMVDWVRQNSSGNSADYESVSSAIESLNTRDPRTGMTPLIPQIYDRLKEKHPHLTEPQFHDILKRMAADDRLTMQAWNDIGTGGPGEQAGIPTERFPAHPRHGGPAAWIQTRPAKTA